MTTRQAEQSDRKTRSREAMQFLIRKHSKSKALIDIQEKEAMQNIANETGTTKRAQHFHRETEKRRCNVKGKQAK